MEPLLRKHNLPTDLNDIKRMSKNTFTEKVKEAVTATALHQLLAECQSLKKTASLQYSELKVQEYFSHLYPSQARVVFKWRSETLDLKSHLTYKYSDTVCRNCKSSEETPDHALNCGAENQMVPRIDIRSIGELDDLTKSKLKLMVLRISLFLEKVVD